MTFLFSKICKSFIYFVRIIVITYKFFTEIIMFEDSSNKKNEHNMYYILISVLLFKSITIQFNTNNNKTIRKYHYI